MAQPFELKFIVDLADALGQVKSFAEGMGVVTAAVAKVGEVGQSAAAGIETLTTVTEAAATALSAVASEETAATAAASNLARAQEEAAVASAAYNEACLAGSAANDTFAATARQREETQLALVEAQRAAAAADTSEASELARLTEMLGSESAARASLAATIIDGTAATVRSEEEVAASLQRRAELMAAVTAAQAERLAIEAQVVQAVVADAAEEVAATESVHEVQQVVLSDASQAALAKAEAAEAAQILRVHLEDLAQAQRNLAEIERDEAGNLAGIARAQQEVAAEAQRVAEAENVASAAKLKAAEASLKLTAEDERAAAAAKKLEESAKAGTFTGRTQELGSMLTMLGLVDPQLLRVGVGVQMLGQAAETLGPKIAEAGGGAAGFAAALGPIVLIGAAVTATITAIATAAELAGSALKAGIGEQESETTFAYLLGNVEKAKARLDELDETALKFHLDPEQVRGASEQLTRLSQGALGTGESLNTVIEVSARSGKSLQETGAIIGRLYETIQSGQPVGRMAAQLVRMGAISASDVNHLNNLHKEGAKGPEVWAAAEEALNKYSGAAEARANTFEGGIKGIKTAWDEILEAFGRPIADVLTPVLQNISRLLASLVPSAKEYGTEIKAAVETVYGLVKNGEFSTALGLEFEIGVDTGVFYLLSEFKKAFAQIKTWASETLSGLAQGLVDQVVTPAERAALANAVPRLSDGGSEGGLSEEERGVSPPASAPATPAAPATASNPAVSGPYMDATGYGPPLPPDAGLMQQTADDRAALNAKLGNIVRKAVDSAQKDDSPNAGTEFTPMTPGGEVTPDGKTGKVAGRTKEVDEGKTAEKEYQDALKSTAGMLDAGDLSQAQATAQNVKTTQDYIARLKQLQASMDPASEKYQKMTAQINQARASLLKLAEGQEEYQSALAATSAALEADMITQAQADAQNNKTILAYIGRLKQLQTTVSQTSEKYRELQTQIDHAQASLNKTTALAQITTTFHKVINAWGDLGKNASEWLNTSMNSGIATVSQGLTGLITKTGSWKQLFGAAVDAMLEGLIELGVKTVLHYAMMGALQLAHAATGNATTASVVATQVSAGAAIAAAHAPAAAATSVSSYGVAAVIGAVLAIAAIGAIIALLAGGFAEGGLIPGAPSHSDNRIAKVATGEFVIRTAAVQHWGPEMFEALNNFQFPIRMPAYAAGGMVGGAMTGLAGGSRDRARIVNQVNVGGTKVTLIQPNTRSAMHEAMRSAEGDTIILDSINRQKHKMPFKK